ncbi:hypothetical protein D1007_39718 [Hordeum vulgare]|nr:hypothetical protein D1007_39718 [Hordeum vulgare]
MVARRSTSSAPVDPEDVLLAGVLRRSMTKAETDACGLRCKNVEALRLAIMVSERDAAKMTIVKAKATRHTKDKDRLLCRLSGKRCSSDEDDNDVSTTSGSNENDDDGPLHADAYTEERHNSVDGRKGKVAIRK